MSKGNMMEAGTAEVPSPEVAASAGPWRSAHRWILDHRAALFRLALGAVVAAAAALRYLRLRTALPYLNYVDEFFPLKASAHQIANHTWDPDFFWYGSLLTNLTTLTASVLSWLGFGGDLTEGARVTIASPYTETVAPPLLILSGRLVILAASVGTVWLIGLLGARVGGRLVGLVAAALATVLPMFVFRGSIVINDTLGAFFAVLTMYAAVRIIDDDRARRWAIIGGASIGLAFTSKYTPVAVAMVLLVAVAMRMDLAVRQRVRLLLIAGITAVVAAIVSMPALVLRTGAVLDDMRSAEAQYRRFPASLSYVDQLIERREIGPAILALTAVGLVLMCRQRRTRTLVIGYLAFALPVIAVLLRVDFQPVRNLMPLVPFALVAAAVAIVAAVRLVAKPVHAGPILCGAGAVVVVAVLTLPLMQNQVRPFLAGYDKIDTRVQARWWLNNNVQPGDKILVAEELAFLPSELEAIDADVTVAKERLPADVKAYDYVVMGHLAERPYAWMVDLTGTGTVLGDRPRVATFGTMQASCPPAVQGGPRRPQNCPSPTPRAWFDNRVLIDIYGPPADDGGSEPEVTPP